MIEIVQTEQYTRWFARLNDRRARSRIVARVWRLSRGNPGDTRSVGAGVSEMRIDYGPGYRLYFAWQGEALVVLLGGGDKRTQKRDIERAQRLAREL